MKMRVTRVTGLMALSLALIVTSCNKRTVEDQNPPTVPSPVEVRFQNKVGFDNLVLNTQYSNQFLEFFRVTEFKYYVSNFQFINSNTGDTISIPETYFLIDEKGSKTASFNIPSGDYYEMSFLVGVDAARNESGAQTGALDPALGMFWDRTKGYIMAKMEGTSPASTQPGNVFRWHIGGYKGQYSVLGRRTFKLGGTFNASANRKIIINIAADARAWFANPNNLSIGANQLVTEPGELAKKFGQNYFKMFSFISAAYE